MQKISFFIDPFKPALHFSGGNFAYLQEKFDSFLEQCTDSAADR
jgi:hypothetical protein